MSKSRLVSNLRMDDFFTLPDSGEIWRKNGGEEKVFLVEGGKRVTAYECVSLYDADKKVILRGGDRVELVDK